MLGQPPPPGSELQGLGDGEVLGHRHGGTAHRSGGLGGRRQGTAQPAGHRGGGDRAGQPSRAQPEIGRMHPGAVLMGQPAGRLAQGETGAQAVGDGGIGGLQTGIEPGEGGAGLRQWSEQRRDPRHVAAARPGQPGRIVGRFVFPGGTEPGAVVIVGRAVRRGWGEGGWHGTIRPIY